MAESHVTIALRQVVVTPTDRGPQVNVVAWVAITTMGLAVVTRLAIKSKAARRYGWDDALVLLAMVFAIGQTVVVSLQVNQGGLGQEIASVGRAQIELFEKGQYASDMLYILALSFSKLSCLAFIVRLTPDRIQRQWSKAISISVLVWGTTALFGIGFQCALPAPWAITAGKCFDQTAFWNCIGTLDIVTDCAVVLLPAYIVWDLQMTTHRKAIVILAFASRATLIPAIVLRLIYLSSAIASPDKTSAYLNSVLVTLVDVNLSVFTSCIPFLKPFMENLDSGLLTSDLRIRGPLRPRTRSYSYAMNRVPAPQIYNASGEFGLYDGTTNQVTVTHQSAPGSEGGNAESRTSAGSDRMIIKQIKEWRVEYDEQDMVP